MTKTIQHQGYEGGGWDKNAHEKLYGKNLNTGLGDFIINNIKPQNFLEFGSGLGALSNYISQAVDLEASYCIEPAVESSESYGKNVSLLNIDIFDNSVPSVLDKLFDTVISIEVAEHIPLDQHEALFDFLVSRANRMIVFSGARPGQGGHGHIAERPELEWREEFTKRGCTFDLELTLKARNQSNTRNINHRKNLQIFHAPARNNSLCKLEEAAKPYLYDIATLVLKHGARMTSNLFYVNLENALAGRPEHSLLQKRENLFSLVNNAQHILEIGFCAGHSALLFLLANPTSKVTIVDPAEFEHARHCALYLKRMFPNRVFFIEGYSTEVLDTLPVNQFDFIHLDGGKDKTIHTDLELLKPLVARDHIIFIDDTQNSGVNKEVERREELGELVLDEFAHINSMSAINNRWQHKAARFSLDGKETTTEILKELNIIYENVNHSSIYTNEKQTGSARANYLIHAIRDVERSGLKGAFVEVGVAAGHSSVVATLASSKYAKRKFFLYDTFAGFEKELPNEKDLNGKSIKEYNLEKYCDTPCQEASVKEKVLETGLADDCLFLVAGLAQETVTKIKPKSISILKLDANLYEPTIASLRELYPLLERNGYLIIDDYGHWQGCKEAVDDYFTQKGIAFIGEKIDYACYGWKIS
ncbi:TylF/MycF/NovP-related O-methyltransferase [Alteromonas sp. 1_MG-2023]|uniref:TylF/MycF/NovP-related O-methyltransferase n=1 Tax=Alteromonas sp. 1_MG-2023 TaxID=3062669 RepID=UPI0026E489F0|nr:TylF/MycF/NovP-related O-methyltransferase [Alteromonas sp. 1_MG-2023]MDO6567905.1 TylF/MycF/NovP-related O-methyltransferase [Alteromonas sp. 1_MG-2023]